MREACGIVAAKSTAGENVVPSMLRGLEALQHRGQESWGIAIAGGPVFKRMGLVLQRYDHAEEWQGIRGSQGIGHVRYSTKGDSSIENAQPLDIDSAFAIGHNGTIVNTDSLVGTVAKEFPVAPSDSDTKIVGLRLLQLLREEGNWFHAFEQLAKELVGAYCFNFATAAGDVYVARDPRGYRPLCLGRHENSKTDFAASESCGLTAMGAELMRDVAPGEMVRLGEQSFESYRFAPQMTPAYCAFEYTYFAHPSSRVNGVSVYEARKRIGAILAQRARLDGDVIIPVPDSARPAALGYSQESGIPLDEGLIKDRYRRKGSIRSFIEPSQEGREDAIRQMIPIKETVSGERVIVVDDSIVRGSSAKVITNVLKVSGARKVSMVITFPPIRFPCYMGIDFPTREELLAYRVCMEQKDADKVEEKLTEVLGVDRIEYNDIEGLSEGIGIPAQHLCLACVTGDYSKLGAKPTLKPQEEIKC